jgi:hypothetical protein
MKKYFLIWAVTWIVVYIIVSKTGYPDAPIGVMGAAVVSLFFMLKILGSSWSGEVVEIKTIQESYTDSDHHLKARGIDYAFVKLPSGKIKKTQDLGWKVGDKLEKKSGQIKPKRII